MQFSWTGFGKEARYLKPGSAAIEKTGYPDFVLWQTSSLPRCVEEPR
jgi:hypothetical protein